MPFTSPKSQWDLETERFRAGGNPQAGNVPVLALPPVIDPAIAAMIAEEKRAADRAKQEAEVMKQQADALVAKQKADLGRQSSQYYDRTVDDSPRDPRDKIMFSMGDVMDAPGGRLPPQPPMPYKSDAYDDARVIGNRAYTAPPPPVAYEPPADSSRAPYQKYNYTLNEQGRQAMAGMGNKPAPAPMPPEVLNAISQYGGSADGYKVNSPSAVKQYAPPPHLTQAAMAEYRQNLEDGDMDPNAALQIYNSRIPQPPAPLPPEAITTDPMFNTLPQQAQSDVQQYMVQYPNRSQSQIINQMRKEGKI